MVIMRIARKGKVWDYRCEMQHCRQLDSEFARRMHCHTKLKRLTNMSSLNALSDAAPERRIQKNDVDANVEDVFRKLLEVHDYCVGCKRHSNFLSNTSHPV